MSSWPIKYISSSQPAKAKRKIQEKDIKTKGTRETVDHVKHANWTVHQKLRTQCRHDCTFQLRTLETLRFDKVRYSNNRTI